MIRTELFVVAVCVGMSCGRTSEFPIGNAGGSAGGSTAGGFVSAGGFTAGGFVTAGGSTAGGFVTAGGSTAGGFVTAGGSTAGGFITAGGSAAGGPTGGGFITAGGSTAGGPTGGGFVTAGGSGGGFVTAGGATAGGFVTAGGSTAGGPTSGGSTAGGTAGGPTSGGSTAGGTAGGMTAPTGCADGTREGLVNLTTFPDVAACEGTWSGWIDEPSASSICATGWHVCRGTDAAIGRVTFQQATSFLGCFAFDTAHDCGACYPTCRGSMGVCRTCCVPNTPTDPDMGGVGANCIQLPVGTGSSCLATGRVDSSQNSTGCQWNAMITGVACCRN